VRRRLAYSVAALPKRRSDAEAQREGNDVKEADRFEINRFLMGSFESWSGIIWENFHGIVRIVADRPEHLEEFGGRNVARRLKKIETEAWRMILHSDGQTKQCG
jgi:hypothetical protein